MKLHAFHLLNAKIWPIRPDDHWSIHTRWTCDKRGLSWPACLNGTHIHQPLWEGTPQIRRIFCPSRSRMFHIIHDDIYPHIFRVSSGSRLIVGWPIVSCSCVSGQIIHETCPHSANHKIRCYKSASLQNNLNLGGLTMWTNSNSTAPSGMEWTHSNGLLLRLPLGRTYALLLASRSSDGAEHFFGACSRLLFFSRMLPILNIYIIISDYIMYNWKRM